MLFESKIVNKVLGIRQMDLSQWRQRGLIKVTQPAMGGTGSRNLYSIENICQIKIFDDLAKQGIKRGVASVVAFDDDILKVIKRVIKGTKNRNVLLPGTYLAMVRKPQKWQASIVDDVGAVVDIYRKNHGLVLLFNLARIIETIKILLDVIEKVEGFGNANEQRTEDTE